MNKQIYWNGNGKYQKEYNELCKKLVPASGMAKTIPGEALRRAVNFYYDFYNNGMCNKRFDDKSFATEFIDYAVILPDVNTNDVYDNLDKYGWYEEILEQWMDAVIEKVIASKNR